MVKKGMEHGPYELACNILGGSFRLKPVSKDGNGLEMLHLACLSA